VTVNGHALIEPYVFIDQPGYSMTFKQVVVPRGHIFVMGDHRNDSYDSRAPDVGPIPTNDVVGRAFVTIWPPSRWRWLGRPATFKDWPTHTAAATPLLLSSVIVFGAAGLRRRLRRRSAARRPGPA
jgi:signal peptidase I